MITFSHPYVNYTESPQTNPIYFTILKKYNCNFETISSPFKCRDFFNEITSIIHGFNPDKIYEFELDEKNFVNDGKVYMIISTDKDCFEENFKYINKIEKINEYPLSKITPLSDLECSDQLKKFYKHYNYLIEVPVEWFNTTISISLYTFLLRICNYVGLDKGEEFSKTTYCRYNGTSYGTDYNLKNYFNKNNVNFELFVNNIRNITEGTPVLGSLNVEDKSKIDWGDVHDEGGIVQFCYSYSGRSNSDIHSMWVHRYKQLVDSQEKVE